MKATQALTLILSLGLSTALVGCDDKKDAKADAKTADKADGKKADKADEKKEEKKADAASDNPLIGTWELDLETFKQMEEFTKAPPEQQKMMEGMLGSMKMELTFTADAMKMNMKAGEEAETKEGKYTIKSNDGGKLVIESEVDGKKEEVKLVVDGDKLIMDEGKQKMALKRKS